MTLVLLLEMSVFPSRHGDRLRETVQQFLSERCDIGPGLMVRAGDLYSAYSDWTDLNGIDRLSNQKFANRLLDQFERDTSGRHRYYRGIDFRSDD